MKKVNLLSRAEMKKVMGGTEPAGGTCGVNYWCNNVRISTLRGISKDDAQMIASAWDGCVEDPDSKAYWCCDSCD